MTVLKNKFNLPKLEEIEEIKFIEHRNHRISIKPVRNEQLHSIYEHSEIYEIQTNKYFDSNVIGSNFKLTGVHGLVDNTDNPGMKTIDNVVNVTHIKDNGKPGYLIRDKNGNVYKMSLDYVFPIFIYMKDHLDFS